MTAKQAEALEYMAKEASRYKRLAQRYSELDMQVASKQCYAIAKELLGALELQEAALRWPDRFLEFK